MVQAVKSIAKKNRTAEDSVVSHPVCDEFLGQLVGERFLVVRKIGRGGMGTVYLAHHQYLTDGPRYAVKIMRRENAKGEQNPLLQRFEREAKLLGHLHHSHIVRYYAHGEDRIFSPTRRTTIEFLYLVMEYIVGPSGFESEAVTLGDLVMRGPLGLRHIRRIMRTLTEALSEVHRQGIVHRDIKSSNILINKDGEAVLADFGISKPLGTDWSTLTKSGMVVMSCNYASPEQLLPNLPIDARTDIYPMGILLLEMLTGRLMLRPRDHNFAHTISKDRLPSHVRPDVGPSMDAVILRALHHDSSQRFQSMKRLYQAVVIALFIGRVERHLTAMIIFLLLSVSGLTIWLVIR
ncbi:TPA: hypothetical protein DDW35_07640 [Candidatus Sumerlaeota bacterium]|jgi:eukaryotic-like serine/threonine-protein kinase|nr:hypothetical protein [Candidatus Sumerlaeota bacterium]